MKNTLISYGNLDKEIKQLFKEWLNDDYQDEITFPFRGAMATGYLFQHEDTNYLIAMNAKAVMNVVDEDEEDEDVDVDAEVMDLDDEEIVDNEDAA